MFIRALIFLLLALIIGCGSPQRSKFQGVEEDKNYVAKGVKYLEDGDVLKAIRNFDMAIKNEPSNPDNYITLGQVYIRLKNYPRAIDTLSAATRVSPLNGEVYYLLAVSQRLNGDLKGALESAQRSVILYQRSGDKNQVARSATVLKNLLAEAQQLQVQEQSQQNDKK